MDDTNVTRLFCSYFKHLTLVKNKSVPVIMSFMACINSRTLTSLSSSLSLSRYYKKKNKPTKLL